MKDSDKNSSLYTLSKVIKWQGNAIAEIKLSTGHVLKDPLQIKNYFLRRFQQWFSSGKVVFLENLCDLIWPSISNIKNEQMFVIPSLEEIQATLMAILDLKALDLVMDSW